MEPSEWVESYLPQDSFAGFNLALHRRRVPVLVDMQGRVVHSWPGVRAVGRARLDRNGRLMVIGVDDMIKEYDWDGNLVWQYFPEGTNPHHRLLGPHHDVWRKDNGNTLLIC